MEDIHIKVSPIFGAYDENEFTKEDLMNQTLMHREDVRKGMQAIANDIADRSLIHDHTKLTLRNDFYEHVSPSKTPNTWLKEHITQERHHLLRNVPDDVNLVDIIEFIVDCVMAGTARRMHFEKRELPEGVLQKAFDNTIDQLLNKIKVDI